MYVYVCMYACMYVCMVYAFTGILNIFVLHIESKRFDQSTIIIAIY